MTKEQFDESIAKKAASVLRLLREKAQGYNPTIGTAEYDPFYNYSLAAEIAGVTQEQNMIGRMGEKVIRLRNILENPERAGKESIDETCSDIVGIALLVWASAETLNDEVEVQSVPPGLPPFSEKLSEGNGPLAKLLSWGQK